MNGKYKKVLNSEAGLLVVFYNDDDIKVVDNRFKLLNQIVETTEKR